MPPLLDIYQLMWHIFQRETAGSDNANPDYTKLTLKVVRNDVTRKPIHGNVLVDTRLQDGLTLKSSLYDY